MLIQYVIHGHFVSRFTGTLYHPRQRSTGTLYRNPIVRPLILPSNLASRPGGRLAFGRQPYGLAAHPLRVPQKKTLVLEREPKVPARSTTPQPGSL